MTTTNSEEIKARGIEICRRCGGLMENGYYIRQTCTGVSDFGPEGEVVTMSPGGPGRLSPCRKCGRCGHSVTC